LRDAAANILEPHPTDQKRKVFKLEFAFDDITGQAVMIGNNGVSNVDIHVGPLGVTFMEKLDGGAVQTTTVATEGASVRSRHSILNKKTLPSQYYGQCKVLSRAR
jgi:hypothetical protein